MSMGGIKYGWRDSRLINPANPASYTAFDSLSFLFEGALYSNISTLKSAELSQESRSASLNYLTFGFPVTHWWKASFGLLPYSNVGYNVLQEKEEENIGLTRYRNEGSGGLNQVYFGSGFKISDNLSLGVNASFVFGTIDRGVSVTFPDSGFYISSRIDRSVTANDFVFTYGLQYTKPLKNDLEYTIGISFSNQSNLRADKDYLVRSFYGEQSNIRFYRDTIQYNTGVKGDIILPAGIGAGITFKKKDKWLIGADFDWQNWEKFRQFDQSDSLDNRFSIGFGAQFIPDRYSVFSYWERLSYRFGFRYTNGSLNIRGNQINEYGISFGIGFPVWKSRSMMNLGVELGRWGTTKDNLIQENFIRVIFAISIYENWFIKPKYN